MAWRVARALGALRGAFDARFPSRDRTTDGAYGDPRHQLSPSGHNPDDTAGSLPESHDADNDPEVRAIDVDADLREPGVTMMDVVRAILATPADRDRLLYIIFDRKIWSKSQGWRERPYSGDNPHTGHAHYSGDPAYDEDTRPWVSVLQFGKSTKEDDDMARRVRSGAGEGSIYLVPGWRAPSGLWAAYGLDGPTNARYEFLPMDQLPDGMAVGAAGLYDTGLGHWNAAKPPKPPATPGGTDAAAVAATVVKAITPLLAAPRDLPAPVVDALTKIGDGADALVAALAGQ